MQKHTIGPGVTLYHLPFEHFKTVSIRVYFHQPLSEKTATVNALLPNVLMRGCRTYPTTRALNLYLEELYGATADAFVSKRGEDQITCFAASGIADAYVPEQEGLVQKVATVLHDLILDPLMVDGAFNDDYVRQEKKGLKEGLLARINDKRSYATDRCVEEMCKNDPYAVYEGGDAEQVEGITNEDLVAAYHRLFEGPVTIFVTGKADVLPICELFSDLKGKELPYPVGGCFVPAEEPKTVVESMDVTQGKLVMGFSTGVLGNSNEFVHLMVANSVFGSGPHSKLFKNVREKLSLAYYAYSRTDRIKGLMMVGAGIEFSKFDAAREEILKQLESVQKGEITEEELFSAKKALTSALLAMKDSPAQSVSWTLGNILSGSAGTAEERIREINAVTVEEIVAVFQKVRLQTTYFLNGKEAQ